MTASNNYAATVLADSPLAYYRLADSSGTSAVDATGNARTGTTHGSPTLSVTSLLIDSADSTDKAMTFNAGSSQYISLPLNFTPVGANPWSLECWMRVTVAPTSTTLTMAGFGTNATKQSAQIKMVGGTPAIFECSTYFGDISGGTVLANTTYHVVGTYDGTSTRLYVNGALIAGPTNYVLNVVTAYASIGADNTTPGEFFTGTLDEVAIYGTALSATQVSAHYNAGLAITRTLGIRTRLAVTNTKSVGMRTRLRVANTRSLGLRTRLAVPNRSLGIRTVLASTPQTLITIANNRVIFDETSFILHQMIDERQRCQFTVLDYPGVASYTSRQQVVVTDPTQGRLFSGVVIDSVQDKTNEYPDPTIEHQIDTVDNAYFPGKRTSNRFYTTPTYAGKIALDTVIDALAAEGITAPYAQQVATTISDWNMGTLSGTSGTANVGDGDLELQNNGPTVTMSYATLADWSTGTLTSAVVNTSGDISLVGVARTWDDGSKANQTLYGLGTPSDNVSNGFYGLFCAASSETRSRLDFAGLWQNGIIEVDLLGLGGNRRSVTWRTTVWSNVDAYAYACEVTQSYIEIRVGTNGGANTNTSLGIYTFPTKLAGGTYRLRVVVNGPVFTASLNGVQYLSVSDSTWVAPAMLTIRNRNQSTIPFSMQFDNFGVMAATSGTWQSAAVSIAAVTLISTSVISWDASLSTGGTVQVQTSLDGALTWQIASNGGSIPLLPPGGSGTGKTLTVRVTLSTTTTAQMPDIKSLNWTVTAGYVSSGTRISPALSLTPVGTLGNMFIAWNATLPSAATTFGIDTSIDGGTTWTDVTAQNGGPIPGLNTQPEPTVDGFLADSSVNYTAAMGTGGTLATWTYDLTHSRVTATGGASALFLYNALSQSNVDLFVDLDLTDAGGLVWNYSDANNYYALSVADASASVGTPNTISLYKMVAGAQSTLASGSIVFQRGTYRRVRVTSANGTITAYFDGAQVLSVVDGTPLAAGQAGLYQSGSTTGGGSTFSLRAFGPTIVTASGGTTVTTTTRFYLFWIQPLGDSATGKTVTTRCRLATTDATVTPQVLDLTVTAFTPNIGIGTLIPTADYRQVFLSKVLDDCAKQSNYLWYIDSAKALHFAQRNAYPAPWIVQSSSIAAAVDLETDALKVDVANDLYRNRQILTGVIYTASFVDNFQGDTQLTSFPLSNPVAPGTIPVITLNLVPQKVAKKGSTGAQWYYAENDLVIAQDAALTALVPTDRLKVTYTGTYIGPLTINNTAAQAALALIEGGTGIVEAVEDVSARTMFLPAATVYANQLLVRYCVFGRTVTYSTYRNGLQVGMIQNVFLPEEGIFDVQMLITAIDITMQTQPNSTILYKYVVTITELPNAGSWQKLFGSGIPLTP